MSRQMRVPRSWKPADKTTETYERPYLQIPRPMEYYPHQSQQDEPEAEQESPRVIIVDI